MRPLLAALVLMLCLPPVAGAQDAVRLAGALRQAPRAVPAGTTAPAAVQGDTVIVYDSGTLAVVTVEDTPRDEAYEVGAEARQANRFVLPPEGLLTGVSVAPFYLTDFEGTVLPDTAARDFRLVIWDHNDGRPGDTELFALDVTDNRGPDEGTGLAFLNVDLAPFADDLAALPDTFYVGLTNAGDDENHLVMGVTEYSGDIVSFLYRSDFFDGQGGWRPFDEIFSPQTTASLADRVLPIRATFLVPDAPTATDDALEVPASLTLHANYPNPFNPTTTIAYDLPQAADVHLAVYDLLGRRIATLVDAVQPAGAHQVAVDATGWAGGVYLYTIEAGAQRQTRRMVVLK